MQLCDRDILKALSNGEIGFVGTNPKYPFSYEKQVQPSSIDLRLGDIIVRFKDDIQSLDIKDPIDINKHLNIEYHTEGQPINIRPQEIVYGQVYEQMWIGDTISARIEGRSRVARLGLSIHTTGSYINPGFCGAMPLQLVNYNKFPITIYPYISICQLVLFQISGEPLVRYADRSRILNPYFDEKMASPSVLNMSNESLGSHQTIVERRMEQLVQEYYRGIRKEEVDNFKSSAATNPIIIQTYQSQGGISHMRDVYSATQAGIQRAGAGANATVNQYYNEGTIDGATLLNECNAIKNYIKTNMPDNDDNDILLGDISKASKALSNNKQQDAISILKSCGSKLYDIAKTIGCSLIAKILSNQLGL